MHPTPDNWIQHETIPLSMIRLKPSSPKLALLKRG